MKKPRIKVIARQMAEDIVRAHAFARSCASSDSSIGDVIQAGLEAAYKEAEKWTETLIDDPLWLSEEVDEDGTGF